MLSKLIRFSIFHRLPVLLGVLALVVWGGWSATRLPVDAVPDITNNQVQVITSAPQLAAEDIERLVTFPVEQAMATLPGRVEMRSFSRFGLSVVTLVFEEDVDVYWARAQIDERLVAVRAALPAGDLEVSMAPVTTGLGEIYQYLVAPKAGYEDKFDVMDLREVQDWIVRRGLLGTDGVADVSTLGGKLRQYEVRIDPARLQAQGLSILDVMEALARNNANTGGAYIEQRERALFLRTEGLLESLEDVGQVPVPSSKSQSPVRIGHLGEVSWGHAVRYGAVTYEGEGEGVVGLVMMRKGANSAQVIKEVKTRIAEIEKSLPEGMEIRPFLDRSKLVNTALGTIKTNLTEGALIVLFVLILLVGNWRAGAVVASVIPLALLFALGMMHLFGVWANLMSLGAIDFGLIVDGSVIIVEAILHRLQAQPGLTPLQRKEAVFGAASRIRSSAAFGEIIILIVYLPILFLEGIEGKMFRPMAQTVVFAILGAFLLSLTYVPMMSAWVLRGKKTDKPNLSDRLVAAIYRAYRPVLEGAMRVKWLVIGASVVLVVFAGWRFTKLGAEFIPTLDEGDFAIQINVLQGSSLEQSIKSTTIAEEILLGFPEVEQVVSKIGSGEIPTDPMPIEAADMMVILKPRGEWQTADTRATLADTMEQVLKARLPGCAFSMQQPIQMRFNELMTGAKQDIVVKIYGDDLSELVRLADQVNDVARQVEGASDVYVEPIDGVAQWIVDIELQQLALHNIDVQTVNRVITSAYAGANVGEVYEGERRFGLVVRMGLQQRTDPASLRSLYVPTPSGRPVPLEQLARIEQREAPYQIQRDEGHRRILVAFNVRGRDMEAVVEELKAKVGAEVALPPGYSVTYGGQFENLTEARNRLAVVVPLALALILFLLYFTFRSMPQTLLILTAIPLSAVGGVLALELRGMPFSISAAVGFIALFGVAVLNGIVLLGELNHLRDEGVTDLSERIRQATHVRLRPVLMTAAVASLGFLPMALSQSGGAEVQRPLATVVIGGLVSATLLTLLLLPVLYDMLERWRPSKSAAKVTVLLLLLGASGSLSAQDATGYTLPQLLQKAEADNPSLAAGQYRAEAAGRQKGTSWELGPTELSATFGQYNSANREDNQFNLSQTIPFPMLMARRHGLAQARETQAIFELDLRKREVERTVHSLHDRYQYLLAQRAHYLTLDSIWTTQVAGTERALRGGAATELDLAKVKTAHYRMLDQLQSNEHQLRQVETQLVQLLASDEPVEIQSEPYQTLDSPPAPDSASFALHPELRAQQARVLSAYEQLRVTRTQSAPSFKIGVFSTTIIGTPLQDGGLADRSDRFNGWSVGLSLPIWYLPHHAQNQSAKLSWHAAQAEQASQSATLWADANHAYQQVLLLEERLRLYEEALLPEANTIRVSAQRGFDLGSLGRFEYQHNIDQAMRIELEALDVQHRYNQSVIDYRYYLPR